MRCSHPERKLRPYLTGRAFVFRCIECGMTLRAMRNDAGHFLPNEPMRGPEF